MLEGTRRDRMVSYIPWNEFLDFLNYPIPSSPAIFISMSHSDCLHVVEFTGD